MIKHTQTVRQLLPPNCLCVFDHFVNLALKGLIKNYDIWISIFTQLTRIPQAPIRQHR